MGSGLPTTLGAGFDVGAGASAGAGAAGAGVGAGAAGAVPAGCAAGARLSLILGAGPAAPGGAPEEAAPLAGAVRSSAEAEGAGARAPGGGLGCCVSALTAGGAAEAEAPPPLTAVEKGLGLGLCVAAGGAPVAACSRGSCLMGAPFCPGLRGSRGGLRPTAGEPPALWALRRGGGTTGAKLSASPAPCFSRGEGRYADASPAPPCWVMAE
mmetsp:Transcript_33819/g.74985  ORF Transcript_33819/g.74985 Transcript_33819/m.74985 type:complete len:211 (+) Transcript_33819:413-1045(+)